MEKKINYHNIITIGTILILLGFVRYIPELKESAWQKPIQLMQGIGFFMYGCGILRKKRLGKITEKKKSLPALIFFFALFSFQLHAQSNNYSKQIEALQTSFENKNIEALKEYLSPELKFGPIPA